MVCAVTELSPAEISRIAADPAEFLRQNMVRPVKVSHASLIVEAELRTGTGPVRVAYKQYRPRSWRKATVGLFRKSRAALAWRRAEALLQRGVATARPILVCQPRGWRRAVSYLATEWIEAADNLHLYGWRLANEPERLRLREAAQCAESLGRLLGRMHRAGIAHRDLKAANLLVRGHGDDIESFLIDLDGLRLVRRLNRRQRAANLARLAASMEIHAWVSRTIRSRFLRAYAAEFPAEESCWKTLWRAVALQTRRIRSRPRDGWLGD
jgi:tRNA A-37 threonylcarbamoyl transferase component Bud32